MTGTSFYNWDAWDYNRVYEEIQFNYVSFRYNFKRSNVLVKKKKLASLNKMIRMYLITYCPYFSERVFVVERIFLCLFALYFRRDSIVNFANCTHVCRASIRIVYKEIWMNIEQHFQRSIRSTFDVWLRNNILRTCHHKHVRVKIRQHRWIVYQWVVNRHLSHWILIRRNGVTSSFQIINQIIYWHIPRILITVVNWIDRSIIVKNFSSNKI